MNVHTTPHTQRDSAPLGCYPSRIETFAYFSLFSGIGGFELGIERAVGAQCSNPQSEPPQPEIQQRGERPSLEAGPSVLSPDLRERRAVCAGFSEIDKYAQQIYLKHFPHHTPYGDITKIAAEALPDFDLLCGGFPCQAFSIAGKRRGFEDTRGTLFFEIARLAAAKRPRLLFLENVKGLLSHDEGRTFYTIIETLDELGYDLQWQVLNSKDFGVPQNRERVFIVGHLRGTPRPEVFPFTDSDGSAQAQDVRNSEGFIAGCLGTRSGSGQANFDGSTTLIDEIDNQLVAVAPRGRSAGSALESRKDQLSNALRSASGGSSKAMLSTSTSIRRLTPIECERLQGFPDNWTAGISDTQRYKCLGNAVTVNVIEAIARRLFA